jgi:hypothetical protein
MSAIPGGSLDPAGTSTFERPVYLGTPTPLNLGFSGTTYTWAGLDIGAADLNRQVIVGFSQYGISDVTSITVGGITAAVAAATVRTSNSFAAVYIANVPTGTTATVVVTVPANSGQVGAISIYRMVKTTQTASAAVTADAAFADAVLTLTVPPSGSAIFAGFSDNAFAGGSFGFVGTSVTDDYSLDYHAFASTNTAGSITAIYDSAGGSSERVCGAGAAWGP